MILGGSKERVRSTLLERDPVFIHPSHDMQPQAGVNKVGEECFKCLVSTASGAAELAEPCGQPKDPDPDQVPLRVKSPIIDVREFQE